MTTFSDYLAAGVEQIRKSWGLFLVLGILLAILGAVCIVTAQTATTFSILALGWVLAISGALWLVSSFYSFTWRGFLLHVLNGILRGFTGYLLIRHPDAGAEGVTLLLASLFVVGGVFRGVAASTIRFPRWGWTVFSGLISVALGIYLMVTWPSASTYFIGIVIGVDLLFDGAALAGFAGALNSLPKLQSKAA